jgi:hypothetical protein
MADYSNYLLQKAKMKHEAANAKPEKPRFGDEVILNNNLFNMNKQMPNENEATVNLLSEIQEGSKPGKVMSAGDALLAGAKAGVQRKSFLDDKERLGKIMAFTEKTKQMVEDTNRELYKQEKLYNAKQAIMPRFMGFLKNHAKMSPNDKKVFLQHTLDEYNQAAGTDYKLLSYDGSEPWKVTLSDGQEPFFLDLMYELKTPEEIRHEIFAQSPEVQKADQMALQEHERDVRNQNAVASLHEEQAEKLKTEKKRDIEIKDAEERIFKETGGDRVKLFDNLGDSLIRSYETDINKNRDIAQASFDVVRDIEKLIHLAKTHPKIFGANMQTVIMNRNNQDPTYWNTLVRRSALKSKDAVAYNEAINIIKRLNRDDLKTLGGGRMNVFLERNLFGGNPSMTWEPEAVINVGGEIKNKALSVGKEYAKSHQYYDKYRGYYKPKIVNGFDDEKVIFQLPNGQKRSFPKENAQQAEEILKSEFGDVKRIQ